MMLLIAKFMSEKITCCPTRTRLRRVCPGVNFILRLEIGVGPKPADRQPQWENRGPVHDLRFLATRSNSSTTLSIQSRTPPTPNMASLHTPFLQRNQHRKTSTSQHATPAPRCPQRSIGVDVKRRSYNPHPEPSKPDSIHHLPGTAISTNHTSSVIRRDPAQSLQSARYDGERH